MPKPETGAMIERERPLARCPLARCRRTETCHNGAHGLACRRTHETMDQFRRRLAKKLQRLAREFGGKDSRLDPAAPDHAYQVELRLAAFKRALEARERELT